MNSSRNQMRKGFTLIELLASMAILGLIMVMLFSAFEQINRAWLQGESRVETFTQARAALDFMSKELSQTVTSTNITFLGNTNNIAFVAPVNDGSSAVDLMEVVYRPNWRRNTLGGNIAPNNYFEQAVFTWPVSLIRRTSHFDASISEGWNYGTGSACLIIPWDFYPLGPGLGPNANWPETSVFAKTAILLENIMSLDFRYVDADGSLPQAYWNSNVTRPVSWQGELPSAIPPGTLGPTVTPGSPIMTNGAPAGVQITIGVIDSKNLARLNQFVAGSAPWIAITNEAVRTFTTFVGIPNRHP